MKLSTLVTRKFIERNPTNLSSYALKYGNGAIKYHINDVCFARACRQQWWDEGDYEGKPAKEKDDVVEVAMSLRNAKVWGARNWEERPITNLHRYTRFILNDSVFKDAFLTKNNSVAWANGVDINVDTNHSLCVAGMIALREGFEFPDFLDSWAMLVKEGFHPGFAHIVARMIQVEKDGKVYKATWGGHQTIDVISAEGARKLLKEGPVLVGESFRKSHQRYQIQKTLHSDSSYAVGAAIKGKCLSHRIFLDAQKKVKGDGWAATSYWDLKDILNNLKALEQEVLA